MRLEKKQKNNSENHSPNLLCTLGRQLSNPERKVLQMQKESTERTACLSAEDEDLIDTLIAISVVAKRLAGKLKTELTKEGESQNEQNE
jgi:hypothetical protein|nr:hypothetical protein [uncultured Acetatifactor sp.]